MKILEHIGLSRKPKSNLAPVKGKEEETPPWNLKTGLIPKVVIILAFLSGIILSLPQYVKHDFTYDLGQPWRQEDVTAPYDFAVLKTDAEIEMEKETFRVLTPPIFHVDENAKIRIQSTVDSLFRMMDPVLEAYVSWKTGEKERSFQDSIAFAQTRNSTPIGLNPEAWQPLVESFLEVSREESSRNQKWIGIDLRLRLERVINEVLQTGVINISKADLNIDEITVRNQKERTEKSLFKTNVRDVKEAREYAAFRFSRIFEPRIAQTASNLFDLVIRPNYIYNDRETQIRIEEAISTISPTKGAVSQGTTIIRRGDILSQEKLNLLRSLDQARAERATDLEIWQQFFGDVLVILAIFTMYFMYLFLYRKPIYDSNSSFFLVFLTLLLVSLLGAFSARLEYVSEYAVPVAIAPIVLTIIFDSRVGILSALTVSLFISLMHGNDFDFFVASVTASSIGVYSVRDIRDRSQFFFFTPALILITYTVVVLGFSFSKLASWESIWSKLSMVGINTVLTFFAFPLILIFEKTFKVTTDITLMELSDTNHPLLKALMMRAPGTFHHSLQVANLSEAAAASIGANSLLCRVGSYYHDIGKMDKPEYFVENQSGYNLHDKLKPIMSARIIKSHVSQGAKMAKDSKLPQPLIDFIETHHGTGLIKYFYEKARENAETEAEVHESDFRYEGPLPVTKETGIVLLADGIEATARSMKDPNYNKLENMINRLVDERVSEGQLNHTPLTFEDILEIKKSFLKILVGMYHGRVRYPGQEQMEAETSTAAPAEYSLPVGPNAEAKVKASD